MQAVSKTLQRIGQQLRGFSATARLLIAALMIILVMSLGFVALFAGRSEMVPLGLSGTLNADTRARAINFLDSRGVSWSEAGDDLRVPAEQKYAVLAQLTERRLITTEEIDFDSVLKDESPFTDRHTKQARYLVAKMNVVARMISELTGIERASVLIDQPQRAPGLGSARIEPTASVNVLTRAEPISRDQADAIARMVAGAHAALKVRNVTIVDARSGRRVIVRSDEQLGATEYLELQRAHEKRVKEKLGELLAYIPGVRVAVNAQVDSSEVVTHRVGVEEPKLGVTEESTRERTLANHVPAAEPGVRSNAGIDLSVRGAGGSSLAENESSTRTLPAFGTEDSRIRKERGYALKINTTITVPRSWFVSLWKQEQGDTDAEPDAMALQPFVAAETERIRRSVEPLIDTGALEGAVAGTVLVSMFADLAGSGGGPLAAGGMLAGDGGGGAMGFAAGGLIKSVGLGSLAVVSLLLMFMMVRRAGREEEMPTAEELVGIPPALDQTDNDLVGEASESIAALEGLEIEEGDVRRQQMLDQINDLAKGEPDEAASLIRKWIRTDG